MITDVEDFFAKGCGRCKRFATADCSTRRWAVGLAALRRICRGAGLAETAKWGHPTYMHGGRNIAIIGAFRDDFRLTFMNAALLSDSDGILERTGPNSRHADIIRFASAEDVKRLEPSIAAYLKESMGYAEKGTKPAKENRELVLPGELADALKTDLKLGKAFASLTPGRQRSYVIALGSAKTSATRVARIAKLRDKILSGKGATER